MKNSVHRFVAALLLLVLPGLAQAFSPKPDLTVAGAIATLKTDTNSSPRYGETYNLGATGLRGWIYLSGGAGNTHGADGTMTGESRQILVTVASTPGNAVLAVDDVILGAMAGSSGTVPLFTSDARKAFGTAIGDAEKTGAGTLRVKRWRAGATTDVNIAMRIMGDYTATTPYSCPKSAVILADARAKLVGQLLADANFLSNGWNGSISALALLAGVAPDDPNYATVQTRLQNYARARATTGPQNNGLPNWDWAYTGLFLAEYYLSTGDANVVAGINSYTLQLCESQSIYGTFGHDPSALRPDGSGRRVSTGYGPVNSVGIVANIAIVMGKKALSAASHAINPQIDAAIQRGSDFFAWYANKGPIPYGEHEPFINGHSSNGKDPMCAVLFGLQSDRTAETEYFSRMTTASFRGREYGHTGQGFSYLWSALGANMGGALAVAEYLKQVRWHLDLARRTDGSFVYDGAEQYGGGSTEDGSYLGKSSYHGLNSTASYLLTFSLPLQRLYITGKSAMPANALSPAKVANAIAAANFKVDSPGFSNAQLIAALSEYDPVVRHYAATELEKRTLTSTELTTLRNMIAGTDANGRMAACQVLGVKADATALPLITQRLDKTIEANSWVRAKAATAIRNYPPAAASAQLTPMLNAFAANASAPDVIDWNDPVQISNRYLSLALFGNGVPDGSPGNDVAGYTINAPKGLLYPAVRAGLKQPDSYPRTGAARFCYALPLDDVQALMPDLSEMIKFECLADRMWAASPRAWGILTLAQHNVSDGIELSLGMLEVPTGFEWGSEESLMAGLNALTTYGDDARWTLPTLRGYLASWYTASEAYATLVSSINTIESAITAPPQVPGFAVANSQVVVTTGAKSITLTGASSRSSVNFVNVTAPAHGTLTGTAPNLIYTPGGGYTGPDAFTFQTTDDLTTSVPGTVSIIVGTAGTGLKGEYFDNMNFTAPKLTRIDAQVNFDWGTGSPDASLSSDTFSVRWSGLLLVPETGSYKFSTLNSDGVRLYINGGQVINDYADQTTNWADSSSVYLTAGQMVELQLEYYKNTGSAVAKLKWTGPSFAGANGIIIAKEWLFDGAGLNDRTPYAHAQSVTLVQNTSQAITLQGSGVISNPLTFTVVTRPTKGTLSGTAPNLTYTPAANFSGTDGFTFRVSNGAGNSAPAMVSIGIYAGQSVAYTWSDATSGDWSVASNWTLSAPATTGQPFYSLNFAPSGSYTATHDLTSGFKLNQLNLAGEVAIAGANQLAFSVNGFILPQLKQNSSSAVTINAPVSLAAMTTIGGIGGGPVAITSLISGPGGLTKDSPGTLQISNASNTYSGGTIINKGMLMMDDQAHAALGTGTVTLNGGTLYLNRIDAANRFIINGGRIHADGGWGSQLNGPITLNGTVTIDVPSYDRFALTASISGAGGITTKAPPGDTAGEVTLSGNNSYTGPTTVMAGTLICTTPNALGTGALSITTGAKVALNYTGTRTIAALKFNAGATMPPGTYGSTASPAANKNDNYFSGAGTITVLVSVAPSITTQPVAKTVNPGASHTFTVVAKGTRLSYQWRRIGSGDLAGKTSPTLTLTQLQDADEGLYECVVANTAGSITSSAAQLTVNNKVIILTQPTAQAVTVGSPANVTVVLHPTTTLPVTYQWMHGATVIAKVVNSTSLSSTCTTPSATNAYAGDYKCVVTNAVPAAISNTSSLARLTVVDATPNAAQLGSATPSYALSVRAYGVDATTTYLWRLNGDPVMLDANHIATPGKLTLKNLIPADSGLYTCDVTHAGNTVTGGQFNLNIVDAVPVPANGITNPVIMGPAIIGAFYTYSISSVIDPADTKRPSAYAFTGELPTGLSLNAATGVISGRPAVALPASTPTRDYPVTFVISNVKNTATNKLIIPARITLHRLPEGLAGNHTGLVARSAGLNGGLGGRLTLTVTTTGSYTGYVTVGLATQYSISGTLDTVVGSSTAGITHLLKRATPLTNLTTTLMLDGATNTLTGSVTDADTVPNTAAIKGWRNKWGTEPPNGYAGLHTFALEVPADPATPQGYGYGSVTVSTAAAANVAGVLADGVPFSTSSFVGPDGEVLIYTASATADSFLGHLKLTPGTPPLNADSVITSSDLTWTRANQPNKVTARDYQDGFGLTTPLAVTAKGGRYIPPGPTAPATPILMGLTDAGVGTYNARIFFSGAELGNATLNPLPLPDIDFRIAQNTVLAFPKNTPSPPAVANLNPRSTSFTIAPSTGDILSGKFSLVDPNPLQPTTTITRTATFAGKMVKSGTSYRGYGYFLLAKRPVVPGQTVLNTERLSGQVLLEPKH